MRKFFLAMIPAMFFLPQVQAKEVKSIFGFGGTVDDKWVVLTKEEIKENAGLMTSAMSEHFSSAEASVQDSIKRNLEAGNMEIIFCPPNARPGFNDNINITRSQGKLPDLGDVEKARKALEEGLSKSLGKHVSVKKMESATLMGRKALRYEAEGILPNLLTIQYMVQWSSNFTLTITFSHMSSDTANASRKAQFQKFIDSLNETKKE